MFGMIMFFGVCVEGGSCICLENKNTLQYLHSADLGHSRVSSCKWGAGRLLENRGLLFFTFIHFYNLFKKKTHNVFYFYGTYKDNSLSPQSLREEKS